MEQQRVQQYTEFLRTHGTLPNPPPQDLVETDSSATEGLLARWHRKSGSKIPHGRRAQLDGLIAQLAKEEWSESSAMQRSAASDPRASAEAAPTCMRQAQMGRLRIWVEQVRSHQRARFGMEDELHFWAIPEVDTIDGEITELNIHFADAVRKG